MTKTQIDRLGDRLKVGKVSEADLRLLDQYRLSFADAYNMVAGAIRKELGLEPTGRPAKSTPSIVDKLRRESIRLTQIQDIAGCRLIVSDIKAQDSVVNRLSGLLKTVHIMDRREKPSHGYRAVHVIASHDAKMVEIQVRTELQHMWAECSEKMADSKGSEIKYGGGDEATKSFLNALSDFIAMKETHVDGTGVSDAISN
ncbi:MAG: hypothetical protein HZA20_01805 [Nitrospirae bacterium]|nr:hypothetical protein [Nitrospirota bacterium]